MEAEHMPGHVLHVYLPPECNVVTAMHALMHRFNGSLVAPCIKSPGVNGGMENLREVRAIIQGGVDPKEAHARLDQFVGDIRKWLPDVHFTMQCDLFNEGREIAL